MRLVTLRGRETGCGTPLAHMVSVRRRLRGGGGTFSSLCFSCGRNVLSQHRFLSMQRACRIRVTTLRRRLSRIRSAHSQAEGTRVNTRG